MSPNQALLIPSSTAHRGNCSLGALPLEGTDTQWWKTERERQADFYEDLLHDLKPLKTATALYWRAGMVFTSLVAAAMQSERDASSGASDWQASQADAGLSANWLTAQSGQSSGQGWKAASRLKERHVNQVLNVFIKGPGMNKILSTTFHTVWTQTHTPEGRSACGSNDASKVSDLVALTLPGWSHDWRGRNTT